LANDPNKANELFTLALSQATPQTQAYADLLVDRSIARATAQDYQGALDDLSLAQLFVKESVSIYVLKASAYRALKKYDKAAQELANAFRINPDNREGLLERGNLRRETGDNDGARQDWLKYLQLYPDSPEAAAVRKNLEDMDVKVEDLPEDDEKQPNQ
jgi:regulator of sirC expression with transglutaminase-like and TPR domain